MDVIDEEQSLEGYRLIAAPMLYLVKEELPQRLLQFVQAGGGLLLTYFSGITDENDLCFQGGFPCPLGELAGVWAENDFLFLLYGRLLERAGAAYVPGGLPKEVTLCTRCGQKERYLFYTNRNGQPVTVKMPEGEEMLRTGEAKGEQGCMEPLETVILKQKLQ